MKNALSVMITAAVLLIAGILVLTFLRGGTSDLDDTDKKVEEIGCSFQQEKVIKPERDLSEKVLSEKCRNQGWSNQKKSIRAAMALNFK